MFEAITNSLEGVFSKLRGKGRLTEANIKDGLHEVRLALLEADVNYKVVKDFIQHATERAVGEEVIKSIAPGQQVIKIVHDELIKLMGESDTSIPFKDGEPMLIMLVGLQGSGKTTTAGKLAKTILSKGRKPLLVAADVQRPAAIEQLKVLGQQLNVPVYFETNSQPVKICKNAVKHARENANDVVILDTAGRLHIDDELMLELKEIKEKLQPEQIYFVCDSMTGQDAVNSAKEFNTQLGFDGAILTKLDGDTRGGAALSIRAVTGKPIKFVGIGEKLDRLEEFHPDRMASRILGMGDVVSLVERAQQAIDLEEAQKLSRKIQDDSLSLDDFLMQLQQIKKMGPIKEVLGMIPGMGNKMDGLNVDEKQLLRVEAIIRSMTIQERSVPDIINGSRRQRIANGSGTTIQDVNQLLKQFKSMKKLMKHFKGNEKSLKKMKQLSNSLPFGKGMMR
ncbi:MAG: signal recognition particle protein [Candidatus Brocadia sp. AMX2]|uniref:Signal recognition particle protein n=1 Tax=Candidatus Brocadia sinica JPN1 TaxID=1197129 RepID=A0ABQ0JZ22_9BACT|nr:MULTISPECIES: signal recognition particle protein [Brocadia]KXK31741.1 MAG: signal recognition particle protein [Candidatus Brocadia sinica]MBC6932196.1 signal recognition particle protein [Candidatus Brocadia sp.]MBL1168468.1 signal recognition particle protein [Candidatus Brocadia sp. AMX1]NOG40249.1 signal recognition particle protein [Planctomycetota bacterium]KAA0243637.1 MAG: signal recognition particle protein [Candidatus Brocadia sp. AMX2]